MKNDKTAASASSAQAASKSVKSAPPLPTPEELMEQYAALVWKTAAAHLENPEDVKECVNDTFLELYLHPDHYDPEKGSYAAFLCTIARRKAVSLYRKNAVPEPMASAADPAVLADPVDMEEEIADRLDLEAALQSLKPEEFDIIRMKYYDGMTIKEIADSLNLPYEAVKKRHQRSLTKLLKALTIGLILALIAALAACAYVVLRYFGIVPGYGVNTNPELPFYVLEEPVSAENEEFGAAITDACWNGGELCLTVHYEKKDAFAFQREYNTVWHQDLLDGQPLEGTSPDGQSHLYRSTLTVAGNEEAEASYDYRFYYDVPEEALSGSLVFRVRELSLPFRLASIQDEPLDGYGYEIGDLGGFLVDAYIQEGHLIADLYPLSTGEFVIRLGEAEAVSEDGTVLPGLQVPDDFAYSSGSSAVTVDFGPAKEGPYTIRLSRPLLTAGIPKTLAVPLPALDGEASGASYSIPGGSFVVAGWEEPPFDGPDAYSSQGEITDHYLRILHTTERGDLTLTNFFLNLRLKDDPGAIIPTAGSGSMTYYDENGTLLFWGMDLFWPEDIFGAEDLCLRGSGEGGGNLGYLWEHILSIPVTAREKTADPDTP